MSLSLISLRATLRVARRDILRHRARSVLIVALIATPLAGVVAAGTVLETAKLSPAQQATYAMGTADLLITQSAPTGQVPLTAAGLGFPPGTRSAAEEVRVVELSDPAGATVKAVLRRLDLRDPLVHDLVKLDDGRLPTRPGEAALSRPMLRDVHAQVGDTTWVGQGPSRVRLHITGVVTQAEAVSSRIAVLAPDRSAERSWAGLPLDSRKLYLGGVSSAPTLPKGYVVLTRPRALGTGTGVDAGDRQAVSIIGALVALQSLLMVAAALLVGAKRSERELALIAACSGAVRRDLFQIVAGGSAFLGLAGAAAGALAGIGLGVLAHPLAQRLTGHLVQGTRVSVLLVLGTGALGVAGAVAAGLLPAARASRIPPLAALRGASPATAGSFPWKPTAALGVAGVGLLLAGAGQQRLVLAAAGCVCLVCTAGLLSPLLCRSLLVLAPRLPLAPRLALRDLARQSARTAPALTAITVALVGATVMGTYFSTDVAAQRAAYQPSLHPHQLLLRDEYGKPVPPATGAGVARVLPVRTSSPLLVAGVIPALTSDLTPIRSGRPEVQYHAAPTEKNPSLITDLAVGDDNLLDLLGGSSARRAFHAGGIVVLDAQLSDHGRTFLHAAKPADPNHETVIALRSTVALSPVATALPRAIISLATARTLGIPTTQQGWLYQTSRTPTPAERAAAERAVGAAHNPSLGLLVETGYVSYARRYVLVPFLAAGMIALAAVAIATALAGEDAKADLATLSAVGATSRITRRFRMSQAGLIALLGVILGTTVGVACGAAVAISRLHTHTVTIPLSAIGTALVVLPLIAVVAAAASTPARFPTARRPS